MDPQIPGSSPREEGEGQTRAPTAFVQPGSRRSRSIAGRGCIAILLMGFSSGLPLALTGDAVDLAGGDGRLAAPRSGSSPWCGVAYNLKFLWSPAIDRVALPLLTAHLGRRRGWALAIQALLALALLALGLRRSRDRRRAVTALAALVVAFLSASQDIVIDAYRIELLQPEEQGAGAAATQGGYRFGMIASARRRALCGELSRLALRLCRQWRR